MSIVIPYAVPSASAWVLSDYLPRVVLTSAPAAGGRAEATADQLGTDEMWLITHAVTSCTSTTDTRMRLYDGQEGPGFLLDGSAEGNFDPGDWSPGLQLAPGGQLLAVWTGASAGAVGTLVLQVQVLRKQAG